MDQTEINRIILEASKGSKFYENERKKDEELGRKINATLKKVSADTLPSAVQSPHAYADHLAPHPFGSDSETSCCLGLTFRDSRQSVTRL